MSLLTRVFFSPICSGFDVRYLRSERLAGIRLYCYTETFRSQV